VIWWKPVKLVARSNPQLYYVTNTMGQSEDRPSDELPADSQIGFVSAFDDLINTEFRGAMNAICWHRSLAGDFGEVVAKLQLRADVTNVPTKELLKLQLSREGDLAREIILNDLKSLTDSGAQPSLNLLKSYERDREFDFISTDVYSYHVDRSPIATDTFLCTYYGAASEILPNHQVTQKVLIPEIRRKLRDLHGGPEAEFEDFLKEFFFDLHYHPKAGAKPTNLGLGHLWKLAVDYPGQRAQPCVHRAPAEKDGEYRLLLIC
jgi:hypothetical protein